MDACTIFPSCVIDGLGGRVIPCLRPHSKRAKAFAGQAPAASRTTIASLRPPALWPQPVSLDDVPGMMRLRGLRPSLNDETQPLVDYCRKDGDAFGRFMVGGDTEGY